MNTLDVTAGASGSGTAANSGTATTTGPNRLIVGAMMVTSYSAAVGAGFTGRIYTNIDSDLAEDMVAATAGPYAATATTGGGNWVIQLAAFKLVTGGAPAPTVTGVAPASGPIAGGTRHHHHRHQLRERRQRSVLVARRRLPSLSSTPRRSRPRHPRTSPALVGVTVTNRDGQSGTRTSGVHVAGPAPTVSSVAPASGPIAGGTVVTITGTNFAAGATVTDRRHGCHRRDRRQRDDDHRHDARPRRPALVGVTVTNADSQSGTLASAFTYLGPAPTVTSVAPTSGPIAGGTSCDDHRHELRRGRDA